jgi:hypothetical protein
MNKKSYIIGLLGLSIIMLIIFSIENKTLDGKPYKIIKLDNEYAGSWILLEDLDNDGIDEVISVKSFGYEANFANEHYVTSLIVHKLDGSIMWKYGKPENGINKIAHDVGCQIIDWDQDGYKEIVLSIDKEIIVLNGKTGIKKRKFSIPKHATDVIIFANLTPNKELDLIIKNRYSSIYAYDYKGNELWSIINPQKPPFLTAHYPRILSMDDDEYDELLIGFTLIDNNGSTIWTLNEKTFDLKLDEGHLDSALVINESDILEDKRIAITGCGNNWIAVIDGNGKKIWSKSNEHFESITIAKMRDDIEGKQIIVDSDHYSWGKGPLWAMDENGNKLWEINTDYSRFHTSVFWLNNKLEQIAVGESHSLYDGYGKIIITFDMPDVNYNHETIVFKADVDNDGCDELVFHRSPADYVYIYKTPFLNKCIENNLKQFKINKYNAKTLY